MLTPQDYLRFFDEGKLTEDPLELKELYGITTTILKNQTLYELVQKESKVPWVAVAAIHFRESNQSFKCHLHNGDPLTARTVRVPEGRPEKGEPPFTWCASAIDALSGPIWRPKIWNLSGTLEFMERYNGLGYQKLGVHSPYLWDYTSIYESGLFNRDGNYDAKIKEKRPGCAAILMYLFDSGVEIGIPDFYPTKSEIH